MARSTYIYIVLDSWGQVDSAFTVKHEMEAYIERGHAPEQYSAIRVRDNGQGGNVTLELSHLSNPKPGNSHENDR